MMDQVNRMEQQQKGEAKEIARLRQQLAAAQKQLRDSYARIETLRQNEGLIYKVQIGLLDASETPFYPIREEELAIEVVDGYQKYLLGAFRSYEASLEYRDLLRKFGLKDAWVVPYIDGKRSESREAEAYALSRGK